MTISVLAPVAGAVVGGYHLVRSIVRYRRGLDDLREVLEAGLAAVLAPYFGWQLRGLGAAAGIGYPLLLGVLSGLVHYGQRRASRREVGDTPDEATGASRAAAPMPGPDRPAGPTP